MRQLGLGYANLGALLMARGLPYDSDEGRDVAAAITALMTGRAYRTSGEIAAAVGPYDEFEHNREPHLRRDAQAPRRRLRDRRRRSSATCSRPRARSWDEAVELGERHGHRNAQATVLAPTGHDQLPDGLRHDRDRARLLARQDQGAGRRRPR